VEATRNRKRGRRWVIPATLALALLLNLMPYPQWMAYARPDWVTLVLFYWCLAVPHRMGVGYGWLMGLLMDLTQYTLFGQHAVGKALIALVAVSAHRRLRLYHLWQQCLVILVLTSLDIGFVVWVFHLTHGIAVSIDYWQMALSTTLLWPVVYAILRFVRHRSGISAP
jgi:rod shape-determining protein MreD